MSSYLTIEQIEERILEFIAESHSPQEPQAVLDELAKIGMTGDDVGRAIWSLLEKKRLDFTNSWALKIVSEKDIHA